MSNPKAKTLVEFAFADHPRYDIEAHDLAYDFVENEIGHFYFADSWLKHREFYMEKLQAWLDARTRGAKKDDVVSELDTMADMGLKWSDFDQDDFLSADDIRKLNAPAKKKPRGKLLQQPKPT